MAEANNLTAKKYIRHMKLEKPDDLEYTVDISNDALDQSLTPK